MHQLCRSVKSFLCRHFSNLFYGEYDPETGRFEYANAGHLYPFLLREDGSVEQLVHSNMVLGVLPKVKYEVQTAVLQPGDKLVLYTDGITEAEDFHEGQYGEERLKQVLIQCRTLTAQQAVDAVMEEVSLFIHNAVPREDSEMQLV